MPKKANVTEFGAIFYELPTHQLGLFEWIIVVYIEGEPILKYNFTSKEWRDTNFLHCFLKNKVEVQFPQPRLFMYTIYKPEGILALHFHFHQIYEYWEGYLHVHVAKESYGRMEWNILERGKGKSKLVNRMMTLKIRLGRWVIHL